MEHGTLGRNYVDMLYWMTWSDHLLPFFFPFFMEPSLGPKGALC